MQPNRIDAPLAALNRALDAREALPPDASLDEQVGPAMDVVTAGQAFLQALACDTAPGEEEVAPELRRGAIRDLLALREKMRPSLPAAMDVTIAVALTALENLAPGITETDREYCRAVLLDNGFLTGAELTTFPRESLYAIARQRLARWEETGSARD